MKIVSYIVWLVLILITTSCQKDDEQAPQEKESMSASLEGKIFSAHSFVVAKAGQTTSINGTAGSVSNPESISISIDNIKAGTFTCSENTSCFAVYNSPSDEFLSVSGQIIIGRLTKEWIEGSFVFTAGSINAPPLQVQVSEGTFKIRLD